MRSITIELPEDAYLTIELCAARDDLRVKEGIEGMLTYMADALKEKKQGGKC